MPWASRERDRDAPKEPVPPLRPASRFLTSWPTSADRGIPPQWPGTRRWPAPSPSRRAPQPHGHPGACPLPTPPPPQGDDDGSAEQAAYWACPFPFRSDSASRCRYRAASGGQNREDATTIGRPLSGHAPPARHRQRTTPSQRPTLCNSDILLKGVMSQTADPGQHPPTLPPVTASPSRNTERAQSQPKAHPGSDSGRSFCGTEADILVQIASTTGAAPPRLHAPRGRAPTCGHSGRYAVGGPAAAPHAAGNRGVRRRRSRIEERTSPLRNAEAPCQHLPGGGLSDHHVSRCCHQPRRRTWTTKAPPA
jgi:hypothetical protein